MTVLVRPFALDDAPAVAALAAEFADTLRGLGDNGPHNLTLDAIRRDGFGARPAFVGLVAVAAGPPAAIIGYLLYHPGYDADLAARNLYVIALYVSAAARLQGAGRALMSAAARVCRESGGDHLLWTVFIPNPLATNFYLALGAHTIQDLDAMVLQAAAL